MNKQMSIKKPNSLDGQILLFCKGHYDSDEETNDLKRLIKFLAIQTDVSPEWYTPERVLDHLGSVVCHYGDLEDPWFFKKVNELVCKRKDEDQEELLCQYYMGVLHSTRVYNYNEELVLELPKTDPNLKEKLNADITYKKELRKEWAKVRRNLYANE